MLLPYIHLCFFDSSFHGNSANILNLFSNHQNLSYISDAKTTIYLATFKNIVGFCLLTCPSFMSTFGEIEAKKKKKIRKKKGNPKVCSMDFCSFPYIFSASMKSIALFFIYVNFLKLFHEDS